MNTKELTAKLREASEKYYNDGTSTLSDAEFDVLVDQLRDVDPENDFLKEVGAPPPGTKLVRHEIPMGSLEKVKDNDEIERWINQVKEVASKIVNSYFTRFEQQSSLVMEWKLDGSSIALNYVDGKLVSAATRGDGVQGEDVTENILKIQHVRKEISGFTGSLRGEIVLKKATFEQYFKPLGYKNPRNTVAGLVRDQKGGDLQKYFDIIYYDVICDKQFEDEIQRIVFMEKTCNLWSDADKNFMESWVCGAQLLEASLDQIEENYQKFAAERESYPYEVDGVVIRANSIAVQREMGESSDMRPKWAKCRKFSAQGAVTVLKDIIVTIGHTGAMIPTGVLEPVEIGGVTVSSVLLNNYDYIKKKGVAIGDSVLVQRAGDVIPWLSRIVEKAGDRKEILPPESCIVCKSPLEKEGAHWICTNDECEGVAVRKIKSWITKRAIKFIGTELIGELYLNHNIKEPQDLYKLTAEYLAAVSRGNGVVGTASKTIMKEIEKSRDCPLHEFMGSICIKFLGRRQSEILIEAGINSLEKFITATVDDLQKIPGVGGGIKSQEIVAGIKKARPTIRALIEAGVKILEPQKKTTVSDGKLSDRIICFTGVRPTPEEQAKYLILGGTLKEGVSKALTHLVVADPNTTSNKASKARNYGIKIIGYDEFKTWLED